MDDADDSQTTGADGGYLWQCSVGNPLKADTDNYRFTVRMDTSAMRSSVRNMTFIASINT